MQDEIDVRPLGKEISLLQEMALDHIGIPRPGILKWIERIQDEFLPDFVEISCLAWLAGSPLRPREFHFYNQLHKAIEDSLNYLHDLNQNLEDTGVHNLLHDIAASPFGHILKDIPLDPYGERLLRAAGHPNHLSAAREYLEYAATETNMLLAPEKLLEKAASLRAHYHIYDGFQKPAKRKLFTGLGTMFSGLVLISGNIVVIPIVVTASMAVIPVIGSLAGGIAAVGKGISHLIIEQERNADIYTEIPFFGR